MTSRYSLEIEESIRPDDEALLFKKINEEAARSKGMNPIRTFSIFIKDADQSVWGGATGFTYYGCLYTDMLWVDDGLRNQGWGSKIMKKAETIALQRGCSFACVQTMDWEALPFYQKLGYQIEFIREGYEKNSKLFMLRKSLSP